MKPNFALSLSVDGIRLLHRSAGGWRVVGDVDLDAEDMAAELAVLRKTATALDPGGLRCKLLVPNSQIRYLTVDTKGLKDDARRAAARAALAGATPYAVDDLAFDISVDGDQTHVAAVARETLAEAEAFAVEHRFHPVSFAAIPHDMPYLGEPFFGPTEAARDLLEDGDVVEPDGIAVVVVGPVTLPKPQETAQAPLPSEPPRPSTPAQVSTPSQSKAATEPQKPAQAPAPTPKPDAPIVAAPPKVTPLADPAPQTPAAPKPESTPVPKPVTPKEKPPAPEAPPSVPESAPMPKDPTPATPPSEVPNPGPAVPSEAPQPQDPAPSVPKTPASTPPAPAEVPPPSEPSQAPTPSEAPMPKDPPAPELSTPMAKTSAKPDQPATTKPSQPATAKPETAAASVPILSRPAKSAPLPVDATPAPPEMPPSVSAAATAAAAAGFASRRHVPGQVSPSLGGARRDAGPSPAPTSNVTGKVAAPDVPIEPDSSSLVPAMPTAAASEPKAGFLSRRKPAKPPLPRHVGGSMTVAVAQAGSEAERMTVFGARRAPSVGGKPRFLGLILTTALLVFLAGVAAWASVFLDNGLNLSRLFGDRAQTRSAEANVVTPTFSAPRISTPAAPDPSEPKVELASLDPNLTEEDGAVLDALRAPVIEPAEPPTEAEMEAKYAVTGIWPQAPVVPPEPAELIEIDDLYLTSIDPVSTTTDAVALPSVDSFASDLALASVTSPVAAGTEFALDARGMVVPTAAGALSPDGYTVVLGRPEIIPPATPTRLEKTPEVSTQTRDALVGLRPRERPGDLAETTERAQLDGLTRNELADLRPNLRPQSLQQAAEEEAEAETAEIAVVTPQETDAAVTAALATPPAIQNATQFAVSASLRPDTRPRNFSRIVKRAQRNAAKAAPEPTQVASAASVAPRVVAPSIPSKTSVAQQATVKNAINLRKVNLIGVYGKPSNRRALVRLSNGRYQKVVVGDRIDGGRVSAIGDGELRYSKGGRNHVLTMPKG